MTQSRDLIKYLQSEEFKRDKETARKANYFNFWSNLQMEASQHREDFILKQGDKGIEEYNKINITPFGRRISDKNPMDFVENDYVVENNIRRTEAAHHFLRQKTPEKPKSMDITSKAGMYGSKGFSELKEPTEAIKSPTCCEWLSRKFSRS